MNLINFANKFPYEESCKLKKLTIQEIIKHLKHGYFQHFLLSEAVAFPNSDKKFPVEYSIDILANKELLMDDANEDIRAIWMEPTDALISLYDIIVCPFIHFKPTKKNTSTYTSPATYGAGGSAMSITSISKKFYAFELEMTFLQFVDVNSNLPPGDAFDAYRDIDFERRKAGGFPPALYPSFVSTPEATPQQLAERNKHWKENVEYFQREHNSRWYDSNIDTNWKTAKYGIGKDLSTPMAKECIKYTFEDGSIVYAKTNHKGEVPEPPTSMKFKTNKVEVVKN